MTQFHYNKLDAAQSQTRDCTRQTLNQISRLLTHPCLCLEWVNQTNP